MSALLEGGPYDWPAEAAADPMLRAARGCGKPLSRIPRAWYAGVVRAGSPPRKES